MLWRQDYISYTICGSACADGYIEVKNREGPQSRAERDLTSLFLLAQEGTFGFSLLKSCNRGTWHFLMFWIGNDEIN